VTVTYAVLKLTWLKSAPASVGKMSKFVYFFELGHLYMDNALSL